VILRKLFERIETADADRPAELWRVIKLSAADVVEIVRGLARKAMRIPPDVAGWEWTASPQEALRMAGDIGQGWRVVIRVQGVSKAVDIRALRPGKPGFVYVGGTEFKVSGFSQDVASRTVSIKLTEK